MAGADTAIRAVAATIPNASFLIEGLLSRFRENALSRAPFRKAHEVPVLKLWWVGGTNFFAKCGANSATINGRSFGGDAQGFRRLVMLAFLAAQPGLEPIEIKIDHGCGEQSQTLTECEAAYHGVAERLAQF